jgi:hypothetical protein
MERGPTATERQPRASWTEPQVVADLPASLPVTVTELDVLERLDGLLDRVLSATADAAPGRDEGAATPASPSLVASSGSIKNEG